MNENGVESSSYSYVESYRMALGRSVSHVINGEEYVSPPIDKGEIVSDLNKSLDMIGSENLNDTLEATFDWVIRNTKLFCGEKDSQGRQISDEEKKEIKDSKNELIDIMNNFIDPGKDETLIIPNSLKTVFDETKTIDQRRVVQDTWRSIEVARQCHVCEQTGKPEVGGLIHLSSVILSSYLKKGSDFAKKWQADYGEESVVEAANFGIVGAVDAIIAVTRDNKEKYPVLDKFFSSKLDIDGEQYNYYDFVDYIK
jgi:hypothetical protein